MAKIRVIDLLNKLANGEEMPKKIKYNDDEYWYIKNMQDYKDAVVSYDSYLIDRKYHEGGWLNDTVEILEEQKDIDIQEIEDLETWREVTDYDEINKKYININIEQFYEKINKLIQAVKQLDKNIKDKE